MQLAVFLETLPETDKNVVVVLSGGMDSTILTYLLVKKYGKEKVKALSFNYNQKQSVELKLARKTTQLLGIKHNTLNLSALARIAIEVSANIKGSKISTPTIKEVLGDPQPATYVPNRNMILMSLAASFAEARNSKYIFMGLQTHDEYSYHDTSESFVESINKVLAHNRKNPLEIVAPFGKLSKYEELELAFQLGNVKLENTLTCYDPDDEGRSCGICPSCSERINAFIRHKKKDPVPYSVKIPWQTF